MGWVEGVEVRVEGGLVEEVEERESSVEDGTEGCLLIRSCPTCCYTSKSIGCMHQCVRHAVTQVRA